jgi:hypothetical protein
MALPSERKTWRPNHPLEQTRQQPRAAQLRSLGLDEQSKGGEQVKDHYTALLKQKGDWWIGWIEEVPGVNCQERSKEELIETLRVTLREALEFNRKEALDAAGQSYEEKDISFRGRGDRGCSLRGGP